jgi:hypothetical protein
MTSSRCALGSEVRATAQLPLPSRWTRIDLSHTVGGGMVTDRGLPARSSVSSSAATRAVPPTAGGNEFQIGQLTMRANTGTYLDSPTRTATTSPPPTLDRLADLDAVMVNLVGSADPGIGPLQLLPYDIADKAVLIPTPDETGTRNHHRPAEPGTVGSGCDQAPSPGAVRRLR